MHTWEDWDECWADDGLDEFLFGAEVWEDAVLAVVDFRHGDVQFAVGAEMDVVGKELKFKHLTALN